ncbi:deleted in malignant brain tumors 1 protein-like [Patiria miniata]|uniref:Deleted in malignant brain tumors 1 protein n=1 Tax=Patiria miniata TaxID=46514 RepID=A0A913ZL46_PATMI|nr:deleted in malignant brain tumors 1 protein-like [Patiria miniata]
MGVTSGKSESFLSAVLCAVLLASVCNNAVHAAIPVRLVNGNTPNEGRVEIFYQDQWGTICHNGWSSREANVICRQLGYPSASQAWRSAHFGRGSGPIFLANVQCDGHETSIDQCDHTGWFNYDCNHNGDVGVTCESDTTAFPVRLAGGNAPHEGRVEIFYRCNWGTICGGNWGIEEANVVCRQLGYTSATDAWRNAHFGQGSGPILLTSAVCHGGESSIEQCNHDGWYNHGCRSHNYDVGVTCNVTFANPVSVRLTNGNTPFEGRVEIHHDGQWGTVCDDGWSIEEASVICRKLGYPPASRAWQSAHFGQGSGPILLSNVACNGTEPNINLCEHSGWFSHSCNHADDAGVTCGESLNANVSSPVAVRLMDGKVPNEGRVEVYYRCNWGTICHRGWSIKDANVICRQLGYPSASQAWYSAHLGRGTGPILLDNVNCAGDESSIDQCGHSGWFTHSCSHSADVGVTCDVTVPSPVPVRLVDGNAPNEGRVELYYDCNWGTICDSSNVWTIENAHVICRQLGYPSASQVWRNAHFGQGSGPILLANVVCDGTESRIEKCDHRGWFDYYNGCYHRHDVGVTCSGVTTSVSVRLANGTTPYEGRVEVYYQNKWGTVCSSGWGIKEADVVCGQLGYPSASMIHRDAYFGEGSGFILLDGVGCNGTESSIDQCDYSGWLNNNCDHGQDVGVTCDFLNPSTVSVRLVNGDAPNEGRVEVYYKCHWGTICSNGWSIRDAHVICRQLGYSSASQSWRYAHFGHGTGPILLNNVACQGNESSIDQCHHSGWYDNSGCNHFSDAGVTCDLALPPPVSVRLINGDTPHEGTVEVYYRGQWGSVCGSYWKLEEANVVCRQLGYPSASQAWPYAYFGQGSGPILLHNVECDGHESSIDQCDHRGWSNHYCNHYYDVGVTCDLTIPSPVLVRLADGSTPYEGRVELYYQCYWGTVSDYDWTIEDANVICQQLGYSSAVQSLGRAHFGRGSGPILLHNVECDGYESSIDKCDHNGWYAHNEYFYYFSGHNNDAGVVCNVTLPIPVLVRLANGSSAFEGTVEVYYQDQWGTICDDGWSIEDANVICRQLGLPPASQAWRGAHFGQGSGPILLSNAACIGNESSIDQCAHSEWFSHNCDHADDVGVTCGESRNITAFSQLSVRLMDGSTPHEGFVEVYDRCQWGSIASNQWSIREANVICHQLGYPSASQAWQHYYGRSRLILLADVECSGNESRIDQCDYRSIFDDTDDYYYYFYYDIVGVTCNPTTPPPVLVRLADGSTPHEGRVEVYYKCQWGTICSSSWDIEDANVICRQLGYPSASQAWRNAHFGQGSGPVLLDRVGCDGDETTIDQCDHSGWFSQYCYTHNNDVGVTCNAPAHLPVLVRLADGSNPFEGRVEVYYQDQWGTVCDDGWSVEDANIICRQLGLPPASQAWRSAHFGQGSGPILLGNIACNGNESSIDQCDHSGWLPNACSHGDDAGVTCGDHHINGTSQQISVRLVNGNTPNEGRVEVYYKCFWGTICHNGWTIRDANVICRQLGYPSASQAWRNAHFGRGSGPILLDKVACKGTEESIEQCEHSGWFTHGCQHYYDAGVTCNTDEDATFPPLDTEPPVITCPASLTVETDSRQNVATVSLPAAAFVSDNSGEVTIIINLDGSGQHYNYEANDDVILSLHESPHLLHYTAFDDSDNRASCDMYINVVDNEPPEVLGCPDDVIIPVISSSNQVSHSWTPPMTSDNSNTEVDVTFTCQVTPACYQAGHGTFPVGVSIVRYTARDRSGNENICDFSITVTVVDIVCPANVTALASPGLNRTSVNWIEPDLTGWDGPTNFTSTANPGDSFLIGTHKVTYQQWFAKYGVLLECSFFGTVVGQCETERYEGLTWPVTSAGSIAKSLERCPLQTVNAGQPRAVRQCSVVEPPVYFQWEEYEPRSCGENRNEVTLEDVEEVEVSTGNVVEVAEFLANQTSESSEGAEDVEVVSNILVNIVEAGSGDTEVTKLVLKTVSNVIMSVAETPNSQTPDISAESSSDIIQSVESQVSLTLRQEREVSIRQDTIHVEAVSLDPMQARNGLSFVSVRQPGQGSPQEGSLVGTEVQTIMGSNEIPKGIDVLASVQLPGSILHLIQSADNNNSAQLQASFLIYADDTLFQSASIKEHQGEDNTTRKVAGSVVSLTVENVELVDLPEPVVIEFKAPDAKTDEKLENISCVSWDFELEDGVGDWSTAGCVLAQLSNETVACNCSHATNFAILVDVKGQAHESTTAKKVLDIISQVGCAVSIVALAITLIIYLAIRKLRSSKSRQIFIHFCFSLFMLYIVFLAGIENAKATTGGCAFVAALLHYLTLSSMMWMAVEARNMYVSTVKVFPEDTPHYMLKACLIAWGLPLIVLTITLAAASHHYGNEHYCFVEPGLVLYLGLLVPIGLILLHNIITFILVMRSLLKVREASRSQQISKRLQNAVGISALMGLTWSFGFLVIIHGAATSGDGAMSDDKAGFAFQLIFCLANSFQGLVVFIMFCVRREEVRSAIAPYFSRFSRRLPIKRPAKSNDAELVSTSAAPTSPSSFQTSSFDVSISGTQ